jgi:hypothetical protein
LGRRTETVTAAAFARPMKSPASSKSTCQWRSVVARVAQLGGKITASRVGTLEAADGWVLRAIAGRRLSAAQVGEDG